MDLPNGQQMATFCPKSTKLLILIMTRRNAFDQRQILRQTWLNDAVRKIHWKKTKPTSEFDL
jgi:hypothetical protein